MGDSDNLGVTIFLVVVAILWVKMIVSSNRNDQEMKLNAERRKSEEKQKRQDEIDAELHLVRTAYQALPDLDRAFGTLRSRYQWNAVLATIGLYSNELELLRRVPFDEAETIELPNLQARNYNFEERCIVSEVRRITNADDDVPYYGVDAYTQHPTAKTLQELVDTDFVKLHRPATADSREFICSLTTRGKALVKLDYVFNRTDTGHQVYKKDPCPLACGEIAGVIYRSLSLIKDGDAIWPERSSA